VSKRRALIVVALLVGIVVALFLWKRGGTTGGSGASGQGSGKSGSGVVVEKRHAKDPLTGVPRWLGQSKVNGRRIAGIVVSEDGKPLAGVVVRLASQFSTAGLATLAPKTTDGSGHFDFGAQPAASYTVAAESPKLTAAVARVDLRDPLTKSEQLTLMLHACSASLHGTIYDTAGGAIGGAVVSRLAQGVMPTGVAITADNDGNYELCVPAGGAGVSVAADGYAAIMDRVDIYGRTRRDYQLMPGSAMSGRVVRAGDKAPIEGAIVELRPEDMRDGIMPQLAASDADGKFHFDAVAPGRHLASAKAERLASANPVEVVAEVGAPGSEIVIEVNPAFTVSGSVVEQGAKKPVPGINVALVPRARARWESQTLSNAQTQLDGTFVIDNVLPGKYRAGAGRDDESPTIDVEVSTSDVTGVVFEQGQRGSIAGRVLYDGKPVDGALVRAGFEATGVTEPDGTFVLRGLDDGTHEMYAESHLVGAFSKGPNVTLATAENKTGVEINLDLSGSIAGVVVDQNDAPVAGASLRFTLLHGRDFGAATTATDGTFMARSLSGGGDYLYEVRQRDGSAIVFPPVVGKRFPPIAVKDGATHITGVRIKVKVEKLAIAGKVTDMAGKPVADAVVQAIPREGRWFKLPTATSDQSGAFALKDLPAGNYSVRARTARGEASMENVAAGRMDLALQLLDPGVIDVAVMCFTGAVEVSAFRMEERFSRYNAKLVGTTYQLRSLPVGRYQVTASDGTDRKGATVQVRAGGVETVTLTVGEVGVVEGTVVDDKKQPVVGMTCMVQQQGGDDYGYGGRPEAKTDASGRFRVERAPAGGGIVGCYNEQGANAWKQIQVVAGQVTKVELVSEKNARNDDNSGRSGLTLEDQLDDVLVQAVLPNSPAAKAGIVVGDVIHSVEGMVMARGQSWSALHEIERRGDTVKVVVERNDKQITVTITYTAGGSAASPPP